MASITLNKPSGGSLTIEAVDGTSVDTVSIPDVGVGKILQVQQFTYTSTWTGGGSSNTFYDTPLTLTVTPKSSSSKFLIRVSASISSGYWEIQGRLVRDGTAIGIGDARGSRSRATFVDNRYDGTSNQRHGWGTVTAEYLDSPSTTSDCTYTLQLNGYSGYSVGMNYNVYSDPDNSDYFATPISTITVMEVAA